MQTVKETNRRNEMKVAYNNCYGGFSLSPLAETEYAAKKGITLTFYKQTKYNHLDGVDELTRVDALAESASLFLNSSKKDLGPTVETIDSDHYYYKSFSDEDSRTDPDLIEIIERLGEKANGQCARLAIAEVPDGASFEIDEYDGNESIVPPRQSW